jgi:dihydrofolate reductase
MKTIMLMAITANGFIARMDGNSDFVTADAWKDDLRRLKEAGCCIMGYNTYTYIVEHQDMPLPCYSVIMTHRNLQSKWKNVMFTRKRPKEVLKLLADKGFESVLLYGGAKANLSFFKENLVDEFYLYVVPAVFGNGIMLFPKIALEANLKLLKVDKFSRGVIGLRYAVLKVAKRVKVHD